MAKKWETACPYQIRLAPINERIKRLPDAICLGTHKSGTGALSFLDCHPNIVLRLLEPNAYPKLPKSPLYVEDGQYMLPKASPDEFLIEKSPFYAERFVRPAYGKQSLKDLKRGRFETVKRAIEMKQTNPNVKLFIHVKDPVARMYSHITQIFRPEMKVLRSRLKEYKSPNETIQVAIDYVKKIKSTENLVDSYIDLLTTKKRKQKIGWFLRTILQIGNYYDTIVDYENVFGKDSVYVVDGQNEIINPNEEFALLFEHLGLDPSLIEFKYNDEKGFHCLQKPLAFCLSDEKGHRKGRVDIYEVYADLFHVKEAYREQMFKLYKHLFHCKNETDCCHHVKQERFAWIKSYFC